MSTAILRKSILALGITSVGLFMAPTTAQAGQKEVNALIAALNGATLENATASQLAAAVVSAINANPNLKPGVIAGEALKGPNADGALIADSASGITSVSAALDRFIGDAAVTAATKTTKTGLAANGAQVPDFAGELITTDEGAQAAASRATKSKTAVGLIIQGHAANLASDAAKLSLANSSIALPKLKPAVKDIARGASVDVADPGAFATGITVAATGGQVTNVAVGVTAQNPTFANDIVSDLVTNATTGTVAKKNAAKIAKNAGLVADLEQLQLMSVTLGGQVTTKQVNSVGKALVKAVSGRPTATTGVNRDVNKADELGEIAAYYLAAVLQNPALQPTLIATNPKNAVNVVFNLAKTLFQAAKVSVKNGGYATSNALQTLMATGNSDFAGSFALTLNALNQQNVISTTLLDAIQAKLTTSKSLRAIGGKTFEPSLLAGFNAGFDANPATETRFEDGTTGNVIDPETDTRNG
jgi:hypothetical protein